jgi:hypothetical protein
MTERQKPFVGYMYRAECGYAVNTKADSPHGVPVVVTPLLPDDPRVGETWIWLDEFGSRRPVTILTAPFPRPENQQPVCAVAYDGGLEAAALSHLCGPPAIKTFRVRQADLTDGGCGRVQVTAESKEAALKLLAESLEEV